MLVKTALHTVSSTINGAARRGGCKPASSVVAARAGRRRCLPPPSVAQLVRVRRTAPAPAIVSKAVQECKAAILGSHRLAAKAVEVRPAARGPPQAHYRPLTRATKATIA